MVKNLLKGEKKGKDISPFCLQQKTNYSIIINTYLGGFNMANIKKIIKDFKSTLLKENDFEDNNLYKCIRRDLIQKIDSQYVGDDCAQLMFKYADGMAIININEQKLFYYDVPNCINEFGYVNNYLTDERKEQFPYSDIYEHIERTEGQRINVVNQLLDFDCLYKIIRCDSQGRVNVRVYGKLIKDGDEAIFIQSADRNSLTFDAELRVLKGYVFEASEPKLLQMKKK